MNKTTAIVFFGIIAIGTTISLVVLNNKGEKVVLDDPVEEPITKPDPKAVDPKADPATSPTTPAKPDVAAVDPKSPPAAKPGETPAPQKGSGGTFATPEKAMEALSEKLAEKNFDAFLGFVGEDAVAAPIRPKVKRIIESPDWKLDPEKPRSELSKSAASVRWSLNFVPEVSASASSAVEGTQSIYVDLAGTNSEPFAFDKVSLPLSVTRASVPAEKPGVAKPSDPTSPEPKPVAIGAADADAITIAHAFSKAIVNRDFQTARALSDPSVVTDERVAALMIAVEEGGFSLRENRPMVVTLSREDITWVLTRVQAEKVGSEFALELGNKDGWKVNGLTFSKVLSALAEQAGGGDVAYSPIVEDPMGGDSLVLYFEFDEDQVTPRGSRQLAIIADILSQGAERVIRINGHADALGTDQYNAQLSDGRAAAIRKALISMGVSPDQVVTEAFGETKPRQPNFKPDGTDNPTGRSKNRRAEVYLDF